MEFDFRVDLFDGGGGSLGQLPEILTVFCLGVERVGVEQLLDVVSVQFVELLDCEQDCVVKIGRLVLE